jgi:hypothetical protein
MNERYVVAEYSDLPESIQKETAEDGITLKYRHGSLLMFMFSVGLLTKLLDQSPE